MKSRAVFVAILTLSIGLLACGKYGPPMRRPPPPRMPPPPEVTEPEPPAVEEEVLAPSDFEEAGADQENGP
jgi:hypothetical protein